MIWLILFVVPEVFEGEQQEEMHWYCNRLVNEALASPKGCFFMFLFQFPPSIYPLNRYIT